MVWNFNLRMLKIWNSGYPNFNCIKLGAKLHPVSQHFIRIATNWDASVSSSNCQEIFSWNLEFCPTSTRVNKDFNYYFITNTIKTRPKIRRKKEVKDRSKWKMEGKVNHKRKNWYMDRPYNHFLLFPLLGLYH